MKGGRAGWLGTHGSIVGCSKQDVALSGKIGRWRKPCMTMLGCGKLTSTKTSPSTIFPNLWTYGVYYKTSNSMTTWRMISLGGSRRMGATLLSPLMRCNSLGPLCHPFTSRFGRFGLRRRSNSSLGLLIKIGFGPPTGWPSGVGQIVAFAPFASVARSRLIIFLCIAGLP
jgi:hypothetical protein